MTSVLCDTDGCHQLTVAKCIHCNNHLCLTCLTRHQQPIDIQLCQLTNDMNKLLAISTVKSDEDDKASNPPQLNADKQYVSVMEQIDQWEKTMTKQLNDLVSRAREAVRVSFEQITFEIEEWSTDKQIELQQLTEDIEHLTSKTKDDPSTRLKIDEYQRQIHSFVQEYESTHVELNLIDTQLLRFPPSTLQVFHLFEYSRNFDLSLIRDPANVCFDASNTLLSHSSSSSSLSPSNSFPRREKIFLPSVLVSSQNRLLLFSNKAKQLNIFSSNGTLIDQFTWDHNDIVDICYDQSSSTLNDDSYFVLSTNGSVYSLDYHYDQHTYSWMNMIAVNNQTYYTQILCDSKLSYLYLSMPSKHRLDQWTINRSKRNIIHCSNQLIITNDHVDHLCTSNTQLGLLLRDKHRVVNHRIELRSFTDLMVTICSIALDRVARPMRILFDNRHGFVLAHGNQLCSFGLDGELLSKRVFDDIREIKRAIFCQRSTFAILTEHDQLLFYLLTK